jgi:hypothetical protein
MLIPALVYKYRFQFGPTGLVLQDYRLPTECILGDYFVIWVRESDSNTEHSIVLTCLNAASCDLDTCD